MKIQVSLLLIQNILNQGFVDTKWTNKSFYQLWTVNNGNGRRLGIEHYELSRRQHRTIISPLFPTQNIAMALRVCIEDISCNMMIENMFSNLGFFVCFLYICWRLTIRKHVRVFLFHKRNWSYHTIIIKFRFLMLELLLIFWRFFA